MTCKHTALLIITKDVQGTSSSVAKERFKLSCAKPEGHDGPHHDPNHDHTWTDKGKEQSYVVIHESEEA